MNANQLFETAVKRGLWLQRPSKGKTQYVISDIDGQQVATSKSETAVILIAAAKVANTTKAHKVRL